MDSADIDLELVREILTRLKAIESRLDALEQGSAILTLVDNEALEGALDGKNRLFFLKHKPTGLHFYRNGVVQREGVDFTLDGKLIELNFTPDHREWLSASYRFLQINKDLQ